LPVPYSGNPGDGYVVTTTGILWTWSGTQWIEIGQFIGYTGSQGIGFTGSRGFTGSAGFVGSAGLKRWTTITSNYLAEDADRLIANTSQGTFEITLPLNPTPGTYLQVTDGASFLQNPLIILRNGSTIEGLTNDLEVDLPGITLELVYSGVTWQLTSTTGPQGFTGSTGEFAAVGFTGSEGFTGSQGLPGVQTKTVSYSDVLVTFSGIKRWWINTDYAIRRILAFLTVPAQGSSVVVRINKNGVQDRTLTIPANTTYIEVYPENFTVLKGDYITVDITQIGTVVAGEDLTIIFEYW
jgi:hypothetical protein